MDTNADALPSPVARVVLLGASNLRLGLPHVIPLAQATFGGPLEFHVASGFGRSYGAWSSIPGRALPGIAQCALWLTLNERPSLPTFAMLTDVGNDLLYGVSPQQLIDWVSLCMQRLRAAGAKLVVTELPISSILGIGSLRYEIFRTIFFPGSRLRFEVARSRAIDTNEQLKSLAKAYQSAIIAMPREWYGIDPIHLLRVHRRTAWQRMMEPWDTPAAVGKSPVLHWKNRLSLELAAPFERRLVGRCQRRQQPVLRLDDGSTVAIY